MGAFKNLNKDHSIGSILPPDFWKRPCRVIGPYDMATELVLYPVISVLEG